MHIARGTSSSNEMWTSDLPFRSHIWSGRRISIRSSAALSPPQWMSLPYTDWDWHPVYASFCMTFPATLLINRTSFPEFSVMKWWGVTPMDDGTHDPPGPPAFPRMISYINIPASTPMPYAHRSIINSRFRPHWKSVITTTKICKLNWTRKFHEWFLPITLCSP